MKHKIIYITLIVLFVFFAALQYNDPDPVIWMLIYGSVAIVALLKMYLTQVNFNPLILTLIVILGFYTLTYIPSFIDFLGKPDKIDLIGKMKAEKSWIEETREFFGLIIAIGAFFYLRLKRKLN